MLTGKVALVTGASSGIGEATALALGEAGANVVLCARRNDRLVALAARMAQSSQVLVLTGDLTNEAFATSTVEDVVNRFGRLDILVNSAGIILEGGVADADIEGWRRTIDINLMATLYTCRAAAQVMKIQGSGDIVNVSSTAGRKASGLFGPYSTSKFALNAMTEGMRQELGGHGIRVCTIEPGATSTELAQGINNPALRQSVQALADSETSMTPGDVAAAILFVVSLPPRVNVSELLLRPTTDVTPT